MQKKSSGKNVITINIFDKSLKRDPKISKTIYLFFSIGTLKLLRNTFALKIFEKVFLTKNSAASFKYYITKIIWDCIGSTDASAISLHETFINIFSEMYVVIVPLNKTEIKPSSLKMP